MTAPTKPLDYKAIVRSQSRQIASLEKQVNLLKRQAEAANPVSYEYDLCYGGSDFPTNTTRERFPELPAAGGYGTVGKMTPITAILETILPQRK